MIALLSWQEVIKNAQTSVERNPLINKGTKCKLLRFGPTSPFRVDKNETS